MVSFHFIYLHADLYNYLYSYLLKVGHAKLQKGRENLLTSLTSSHDLSVTLHGPLLITPLAKQMANSMSLL